MSLIIFVVSGISFEIQQSFEVDSSTDNWHDNGFFFLYGKKIKKPPKKPRTSKRLIHISLSFTRLFP